MLSKSCSEVASGNSRNGYRFLWVALLLGLIILTCPRAQAQTLPPITRANLLQPINWPAERQVERTTLTRAGLRRLEGKHVTIVTDLPSSEAVDELPAVVDKAVPLLARYFGVDESRTRNWHVLAMVMQDSTRFAAAGLLPEGEPEFPDGLSRGYELWIHEQSSDFYRRHLLIHEVTHSFMATQLGNCGPGWYMEATAELMGTHAWNPQTSRLELGVMPQSREASPMWGRIKLVRDSVDARQALPIPSVMQIDNDRALPTTSYAWCWALAKFLDTHPRYQERFRTLPTRVLDARFNDSFRQLYVDDWSDLETEWRVFIAALEYGHDIVREAIDFRTASPGNPSSRASIKADRGWQPTPWHVEAGKTYEIRAGGRFVVGAEEDGTPWTSEPNGITLEYHAGQPLGLLLAAIDDRPIGAEVRGQQGTSGLVRPIPIGNRERLTPTRSGTVYLRVNDSPASLGDNRGALSASIRQIQ